MSNDGGFIIEGEDKIRMASVLALRTALKIEATTSLKMSRGRSARSIAQEFLQLPGRPSARKVYAKLNAYVVEQLGANFDRPLDES
jgi:hypothetical protein